MNKELRNFLDNNNIIIKKITIKHDVIIIIADNKKFVIKKKNKELEKLFSYLNSRGFSYFPNIIYSTDNYDIYKYIEGVQLPKEEEGIDIIKLLTILHSKTTYYKDVDEDYYKEIYESVIDRIQYLYNYYDDMVDVINNIEYMSPSQYLFIRNISIVFQALNYSKNNINKWYDIIKEKKRIRMVNIHNNLTLEHYILSDKPYFISWRFSKRDMPIYDIINFYKKYYNVLDFCELLRIYELHYPLLKEEKILLFSFISIPNKIEFNDNVYDMCIKINNFYEYLSCSEKLISDINSKAEKS